MLEVEGLSPKPDEVPPEVGLLAFKTVGEAPELQQKLLNKLRM